MLVIYVHKITATLPPKVISEVLLHMQLKNTQKMNQFIYLSNKGGKYFINNLYAQARAKVKTKAIRMGWLLHIL